MNEAGIEEIINLLHELVTTCLVSVDLLNSMESLISLIAPSWNANYDEKNGKKKQFLCTTEFLTRMFNWNSWVDE